LQGRLISHEQQTPQRQQDNPDGGEKSGQWCKPFHTCR
jgi:hypothetical protein